MHLQDTWAKSCLVAAEFVTQCGQQCISVLERLEKQGKITGYSLKALEPLVVPEDWTRVASMMLMEEHKCTVSRLREVATSVIRERWWTWILLHPELTEVYIHPSRSMYPSSSLPSLFVCLIERNTMEAFCR